MKLEWLPRARAARTAAIEYIAQDSPRAALGQLNEIERQTDMLIQHPEMGRAGRIKGTRELVISRTPFIVVYRVKPRAKRIELLHFVHGAQQWPPMKLVDDAEDYNQAAAVLERVRKGQEKVHTAANVRKDLGLDDSGEEASA